ncbi:MAG: SDR family oxidoreductase [Anaerolineae bacterium]|nr:SDR family oxidoreductase [Anaerolineae bacterium]
MDLELTGKTALVTGASRGLGYATALGLGREGVRVAMNSRSEENIAAAARQVAEQTGVETLGLAGDVSEKGTPEKLVERTVEAFGGLDLLVTNAGGPPAGRFESFDDADWNNAVDAAFLSHVRLIRAALPYLKQSDCASVLTVTSYSVKQPVPNLVLSNSVRSATIGLTKTLALELGEQGIRFNSILPAWTETERITELLSARAEANKTTLESEMEQQTMKSAFRRMGRPEEFANAAVFLLSPAASYITGVMLTVDGGMYKGTY